MPIGDRRRSGRQCPSAPKEPKPGMAATSVAGGAMKLSRRLAVVESRRTRSPMPEQTTAQPALAAHGSSHLPSVEVDCYNIELKDENGFLGDRASKGAFRDTLEKWRKPLRKSGEDPLGKELSEEISKKELD